MLVAWGGRRVLTWVLGLAQSKLSNRGPPQYWAVAAAQGLIPLSFSFHGGFVVRVKPH